MCDGVKVIPNVVNNSLVRLTGMFEAERHLRLCATTGFVIVIGRKRH